MCLRQHTGRPYLYCQHRLQHVQARVEARLCRCYLLYRSYRYLHHGSFRQPPPWSRAWSRCQRILRIQSSRIQCELFLDQIREQSLISAGYWSYLLQRSSCCRLPRRYHLFRPHHLRSASMARSIDPSINQCCYRCRNWSIPHNHRSFVEWFGRHFGWCLDSASIGRMFGRVQGSHHPVLQQSCLARSTSLGWCVLRRCPHSIPVSLSSQGYVHFSLYQ